MVWGRLYGGAAEPVRRKVALKIIKPGMDTKQVVARFEAERQALAHDGPSEHRPGVGRGSDRQRPTVFRDGTGARRADHRVLRQRNSLSTRGSPEAVRDGLPSRSARHQKGSFIGT